LGQTKPKKRGEKKVEERKNRGREVSKVAGSLDEAERSSG